MNIYLLGYMSSGKSTVGKLLSNVIDYDFIDFDTYIAKEEGITIPEIFDKKGEIYFRKKEHQYLSQLINEKRDKTIISLGGGTPCYGTNLNLIKATGDMTLYLNVPFKVLTERLWSDKEGRPLVAAVSDYNTLEDYVRKHLFERSYFYHQAQLVLKVTTETPEELTEEIVARLF